MLGTKQVFSTEWGGRPLSVEVGQLAKQVLGDVDITVPGTGCGPACRPGGPSGSAPRRP